MAVLKLENIFKKFDGDWVLEDVGLETKDNEFVVLLGPSGCGKTTLLRLIAGLDQPNKGTIYLDGRDITNVEPKDRNVSMIFQNFPVYVHLSVFENLAVPLKLLKKTKKEISDGVLTIAKALEIEHLLERSTSNLSGGELQRVALGKALVKEPDIFLMDEPLSDLDAQTKTSVKQVILQMRKRNKQLTLYVTHNQSEASSLADRIAIMHDRRVVQFASPETLYSAPNSIFVARSIGEPTINIFGADIETAGKVTVLNTPIGRINLTGRNTHLAGRKTLLVGLRPDRIDPSPSQQSQSFTVTIRQTEYYGGHSLLWINEIEDFKILLRHNHVVDADRLNIGFDQEALLFFDVDSSALIS